MMARRREEGEEEKAEQAEHEADKWLLVLGMIRGSRRAIVL